MLQQCLENFQDSDLLLGVHILWKSLESLSESKDKTKDDEGWLHFALRKKGVWLTHYVWLTDALQMQI